MTRSSKFGTVNYSADEMRRLNANIRAVLPLSGDDWLRVAYQFNSLRPEAVPFREVASLKRKFKKMYCTKGKTLPDYILEAKELRQRINQQLDKTTEQREETTEQEARELTLKLRQMEEQYLRTVEGKQTTTSTVISILKQSVERKRRTAEEQIMTENEHKGRKRRRVTEGGTEESSTIDHQGHDNLSPLPASASTESVPSLGVMELLLQFLTAQPLENAQRLKAEQTRREQEQCECEERRHRKELRRQQEHRELMLAMAALMGDRFPNSLNHYLNEEDKHQHQSTAPATPVDRIASITQDDKNAESGVCNSNQSPIYPCVEPPVSASVMTANRNDDAADVNATDAEQQEVTRVDETTSTMLQHDN